MKYNIGFLFAGATLFMSACGGGDATPEAGAAVPPEETAPVQSCIYGYDHSTTEAYWTAYKHSAKVEVKGVFDSLSIVQDKTVPQPQDLLDGATFSIYTASVNSTDPERDKKIVQFFFGAMTDSGVLTGTLSNVRGTAESGVVNISLRMNGVDKDVEGKYELAGENLSLRADVHFLDWGAEAAVASLQKACEEKHTGTDGVSTFWPEGKILIRTTLTKNCDGV